MKEAKESLPQAATIATCTLDLEELTLNSCSDSGANYWKNSEVDNSDYDKYYAKANQLVGLVCGLLKFRGWKYARYILNILEEKGINMLMLLSSYRDLRTAILGLVDWQIQILYQPLSFSRYALSATSRQAVDKDKEVVLSADQSSQLIDLSIFPQDISPIISYIGYHICEDPFISTKLCKILKAHIEAPQIGKLAINNTIFDAENTVEDSAPPSASSIIAIFANALLPGLSVKQGTNTHLAFQIHSTLSLLPFSFRFCAYDTWRGSKLAKDGVGTKPYELSMAETKVCAVYLHITMSACFEFTVCQIGPSPRTVGVEAVSQGEHQSSWSKVDEVHHSLPYHSVQLHPWPNRKFRQFDSFRSGSFKVQQRSLARCNDLLSGCPTERQAGGKVEGGRYALFAVVQLSF